MSKKLPPLSVDVFCAEACLECPVGAEKFENGAGFACAGGPEKESEPNASSRPPSAWAFD